MILERVFTSKSPLQTEILEDLRDLQAELLAAGFTKGAIVDYDENGEGGVFQAWFSLESNRQVGLQLTDGGLLRVFALGEK